MQQRGLRPYKCPVAVIMAERLADDADVFRVELLAVPVSECDPHAAAGDPPDFPNGPVSLAHHADELDALTRELRLEILRA